MTAPHVLIDGLVLRAPMGGALRYSMETWPRCSELLHARGGRLSVLLAQSERDAEWSQVLRDHPNLELDYVDRPMHPALRRALRETHAIQGWIDRSTQRGRPLQVVQTQSLPIPKLRFDGEHVHLFHGLRRLLSGPPLTRRFATALLNQGLRHVSSALAVSETLAADLRTRFPDMQVVCAPPACDQRRTLPRDSEPVILCPGPIVPHKNHGLLIETWGSDPSLPALHLHAELNPLGHKLQRRTQALGLQGRITWHAPLSEPSWPMALATCAALVLPSRLESFGMVALEALHAGTPLAVSDLPAHREVVGEAHSAVSFFPPTDPARCAQAIHDAIEQSDAGSEAIRRRRAQAYSWEQTAQRTVAHWCGDRP